MFCKNCGNEIADNALFCTACGTKVGAEPETAVDEAAEEAPAAEAVQEEIKAAPVAAMEAEAAPDSEGAAFEQDSAAEAVVPENKPKKSLKGIIAACIGGVVLLTGVLGFAFKNSLFYAMAPEMYTGNLIANTLEKIADEAAEIDKNVLGFAYDENDKFTVGVAAEVEEDYEGGGKGNIDVKLANNPDSAELAMEVSVAVESDGEKLSAEGQGFWNDENIGVGFNVEDAEKFDVPEGVLNKYFVVPSKNFGDELMKSEIGKKLMEEIRYSNENIDLSGIDLSYTNVMGMLNGKNFEPLKKEIKKDIIEFLEECDTGKRRSVKFKFNDDKVNAKKITVSIKAEDTVDLAINILNSISDDAYIKKTFGDELIDLIDEGITELKAVREDAPDEELDVDFIEYDGRIVEVSFEADGGEFALRSKDKRYALNGAEIEINDGSESVMVEYLANWVNEDKEISFDASVSQNGSEIGTAKAELDYSKGKFSAEVAIPGVDTYAVSGKCSKDDKFTLSVDDIRIPTSGYVATNSMEYDDWFNDVYKYSEESEDNYIYGNERYDELWDIYYDDFYFDYEDYGDWYAAEGSVYDPEFMTYEEWLEKAYDAPETRDEYDYQTGDGEYIDYDVVLKCTLTLSKSADVKIKDREYVDIFKLTEDDIRELTGTQAAESEAADEYYDDYNF